LVKRLFSRANNVSKEKENFSILSFDDEYEIFKYIFSIFEENNVSFVSPEQHIRPGYRTYQAIDQAIKTSKKMLLIYEHAPVASILSV
jgi:hypothetical protein